ncbi:uncharacterized protein SOCEGT47_028930 [Sorangium cellulosum]|uniref:Uncharacterized protein n=1 Tax=Sorangium cellulosum TaxID=56 RepID=A0A4V0NDE5_SORCE|nr:uncharacterized protein SOCEGT47_028930 [Sorangium cellulosum]
MKSTKWDGMVKRYRRVKHRVFVPELDGFLRAWTKFSN